MWSSLISILSVLMSIFLFCSPVFAETTGDIIADMEQASETYEQYELPEEVYEQNKIDSIDDIFDRTNDESESVLDDSSVNDDVSISDDETVDNTDNTDNTDSVDSTDNTDSVDNAETNKQESENTEVEQTQENNAQENTEQEQTVSVDQLYEVNTYILGILIFFLIVVVCKLVYSFFNIFF